MEKKRCQKSARETAQKKKGKEKLNHNRRIANIGDWMAAECVNLKM
jgi:hypothetical protein